MDSPIHHHYNQITYSCYSDRPRAGETFVADHVFSFQISGSVELKNDVSTDVFTAGSFRLTTRNHLIKFYKQPGDDGEYKNISVVFDQKTLREVSEEFGYAAQKLSNAQVVVPLPGHKLLISYVQSLQPYDELLREENFSLRALKIKELILLLLRIKPDLAHLLFDFSEPGKIDLEKFMNLNFHFNVPLERFAYLTGRSLSTFKRDFEKIFLVRPGKWLKEKRLKEAYYLIREKGALPSKIYAEVGFEDLSHFSFAFKKMFGVGPSRAAEIQNISSDFKQHQ